MRHRVVEASGKGQVADGLGGTSHGELRRCFAGHDSVHVAEALQGLVGPIGAQCGQPLVPGRAPYPRVVSLDFGEGLGGFVDTIGIEELADDAEVDLDGALRGRSQHVDGLIGTDGGYRRQEAGRRVVGGNQQHRQALPRWSLPLPRRFPVKTVLTPGEGRPVSSATTSRKMPSSWPATSSAVWKRADGSAAVAR